MSPEVGGGKAEIVDTTIELLTKVFDGQTSLPINRSSDNSVRVRGYFLDTDADMGYFDANRFEGLARVTNTDGGITYLAEKYLPNWPRTIWFKFDPGDKNLYLKIAEGTEQPLDLWTLATDDDISYFNSLLFDLVHADAFDDYDSQRTNFMTHGKLYGFTTPQLQ